MLALSFPTVFAAICLLGTAFAHPVDEDINKRSNYPISSVIISEPVPTTYASAIVCSSFVPPSPTATVFATPVTVTSHLPVTVTSHLPVTVTSYTTGVPITVTSYFPHPTPTGTAGGSSTDVTATSYVTVVDGTSTVVASTIHSQPACSWVCGPSSTGQVSSLFPSPVTTVYPITLTGNPSISTVTVA